MWLCFVLCMKVLPLNPLFSDFHLACTMEMEIKLSRTYLYYHIIFKARREALETIKPSSSCYWLGNLSTKHRSGPWKWFLEVWMLLQEPSSIYDDDYFVIPLLHFLKCSKQIFKGFFGGLCFLSPFLNVFFSAVWKESK